MAKWESKLGDGNERSAHRGGKGWDNHREAAGDDDDKVGNAPEDRAHRGGPIGWSDGRQA